MTPLGSRKSFRGGEKSHTFVIHTPYLHNPKLWIKHEKKSRSTRVVNGFLYSQLIMQFVNKPFSIECTSVVNVCDFMHSGHLFPFRRGKGPTTKCWFPNNVWYIKRSCLPVWKSFLNFLYLHFNTFFISLGLVCCEVGYVKRLLIIVRLLMTPKRRQHWEKLY